MSDYHVSTKVVRPVLVKLACSLSLGVAAVLATPVASNLVAPALQMDGVNVVHAAE